MFSCFLFNFLILVSLTKTNKKGLEQKQHVIEDIQSCAEKYANVFMFSVENMRNNKLKEIRTEWKDSRFVFGKNSVMKLGLEKTEIDEAVSTFVVIFIQFTNCLHFDIFS